MRDRQDEVVLAAGAQVVLKAGHIAPPTSNRHAALARLAARVEAES